MEMQIEGVDMGNGNSSAGPNVPAFNNTVFNDFVERCVLFECMSVRSVGRRWWWRFVVHPSPHRNTIDGTPTLFTLLLLDGVVAVSPAQRVCVPAHGIWTVHATCPWWMSFSMC